jgi:hypothetical protein
MFPVGFRSVQGAFQAFVNSIVDQILGGMNNPGSKLLNRPLKKSIFPVFTPKTCSPQQLA